MLNDVFLRGRFIATITVRNGIFVVTAEHIRRAIPEDMLHSRHIKHALLTRDTYHCIYAHTRRFGCHLKAISYSHFSFIFFLLLSLLVSSRARATCISAFHFLHRIETQKIIILSHKSDSFSLKWKYNKKKNPETWIIFVSLKKRRRKKIW